MLLKNIPFILFLLISFNLSATTIHVEYGFNIFSIQASHDEIQFQKKSYQEKVKRKECSNNLFYHFNNKIKALALKSPPDDQDSKDYLIKYRFNNKAGKLSPSSPLAKRLLALPQDFESFRLATEFRCTKNQ